MFEYPVGVGSNRRYPGHGARLTEERELREAAARGRLHTLSAEQLLLSRTPVTVAPDDLPLWGRAWLRFGDTDVRATVRIRRWTDDAVGVEVHVDDATLRCWVWRGAVVPLNADEA